LAVKICLVIYPNSLNNELISMLINAAGYIMTKYL